ncbi:pilus assembly protein TadG-related protein [Salipiger pacificus]|nr:pilus assembly protein TadG-related protein [Alloyangia pacifica]MCA0946937.1 pilus assembly protein TadG-related protein [Alloyangia pacifica]
MIKEFRSSEDGFIFVFSLLLLPVFIGFGVILFDVSRGNNAHADLQAAADAVALAGARELDGGADALVRARAAMAQLDNTVSLLQFATAAPVSLVYDQTDTPFYVRFLDLIPVQDTIPIDDAWIAAHQTEDPSEAEYVYAQARSADLETLFARALNWVTGGVPVAAVAVAKAESAACDIPPVFICNPFEYDSSGNYVGDGLQLAFQNGDLHGRMIRLHPSGNETPMPGNFGFLDVSEADVSNDANPGGGARSINDYFAGRRNRTCYSSKSVTTKPGASNSIRSGINTRFDMFGGRYSSGRVNGRDGFDVRTARSVRKGILPRTQGNTVQDCVMNGGSISSQAEIGDDHVWTPGVGFNANGVTDYAYGLPDNATMLPPNTGGSVTSDDVAGAYIGTGAWDGQTYLDRNYGSYAPSYADIPSSFPGVTEGYAGPGTVGASRYDVYQYELEAQVTVAGTPMELFEVRAPGDPLVTNPSPNGESGAALCNPSHVVSDDLPDPRVLIAAIIDCGTHADENGRSEFPVNSYASIFMTRPMISYAPGVDMTIDVEIIDITGFGGNGTLETFIRQEAILVR